MIDELVKFKDLSPGTGFRIQPRIDNDMVDGVFVGMPALAIPINRKLAFECPNEHVQHLCQLLPDVTKILVIGWQGTETNFTDLLSKHLREIKKLTVVSVSDALKVMNHLRSTLTPGVNRAECKTFDRGFSSFVTGREGIDFLRS